MLTQSMVRRTRKVPCDSSRKMSPTPVKEPMKAELPMRERDRIRPRAMMRMAMRSGAFSLSRKPMPPRTHSRHPARSVVRRRPPARMPMPMARVISR